MEIPPTSYSLLAELTQEGRADPAWKKFVARYQEVIMAWCRRRGFHREAEDLTQEIMIKLLRVLPRHLHEEHRGAFRSWLKTLVGNALTDHGRKVGRRALPEGTGGSTFLEVLSQAADLPASVDELSVCLENCLQADAAGIVQRIRARVAEKTWESFYRFSIENRSASEVARELNLTVAAVLKHSYRVNRILREEADREFREKSSEPAVIEPSGRK